MPYTKTSPSTTFNDSYARDNIASFYDSIDMPGGYNWNHRIALQTIDLYYNSRYKTGQYDNLGLRKFFSNIVKPACDIATKFIDLDTKDIVLLPEHNDDEFRVWVMQKKLKQWLKESEFGVLLNDIAFDLPKYGSVVIKKALYGDDSRWKKVNLQNLRFNTTAECLSDSEFVYELNSMSRTKIKKMKEWDQKAIGELFARGTGQTFLTYLCYDKTIEGWHLTVRADLFSTKVKNGGINRAVESEINDEGDYYGSLVLYEEDVEKLPYRELHWEKVSGRWLGYGFVEYLEENQIAINEAENLERKGLAFTSLKLWQTRDENVAGTNVLSGAQNGGIIKVDSEITPISMEERNLNAFNNTRNNWNANTERKTFTSDITTGASLPSRTPLGVANLQASLASSYFELKREGYGLFVKELVLEDIIPDFEKDTMKEHILTFLGTDSEIERLDSMIVKMYMDNAIMDYAEKNGYFPSLLEREQVKGKVIEQIRQNRNRYLKIPEAFYRNAKYIVDVNVTGESVDNGAKAQVIQLALQIMGTNPGILQNAVTKQMFFSLLSLGGVSPVELGITEAPPANSNPQVPGGQAPEAAPVSQGGSVALPQANPGFQQSTSSY